MSVPRSCHIRMLGLFSVGASVLLVFRWTINTTRGTNRKIATSDKHTEREGQACKEYNDTINHNTRKLRDERKYIKAHGNLRKDIEKI